MRVKVVELDFHRVFFPYDNTSMSWSKEICVFKASLSGFVDIINTGFPDISEQIDLLPVFPTSGCDAKAVQRQKLSCSRQACPDDKVIRLGPCVMSAATKVDKVGDTTCKCISENFPVGVRRVRDDKVGAV